MVFYDGNNKSEPRFRTKDQSRGNNDIKQHGDRSDCFETDCPMIFTASEVKEGMGGSMT